MADKTLTCRDCGTQFTFTEGEQDFYSQKGYSEPMRCPDCRAAKKAARSGGGYGDSYGNGGYSGGGGGGHWGGGGYCRGRPTNPGGFAQFGQETPITLLP